MIIAFVIDTSASMNQKTAQGLTLLDIAKCGVEHFIKKRQQISSNRDRYMLFTCEDDADRAIKSGWLDPQEMRSDGPFMESLKNLKALDMSDIGTALRRTFNHLNIYRLTKKQDSFAYGWHPGIAEPAAIILITDGCQLTTQNGINGQLTLPVIPTAADRLFTRPYRWDQRIFSFNLQLPSIEDNTKGKSNTTTQEQVPASKSLTEATGGECFALNNMKSFLQEVDRIVSTKIQPGVVVEFNFGGPQSSQLPISSHFLNVLLLRNMNFWPIPESFRPMSSTAFVPQREPHPKVYVYCQEVDPYVMENIPFDKIELESSILTRHILQQRIQGCWQCFVTGSMGDDSGSPFGYIKANSAGTGVNLYLLPYNYPLLWNLLNDLRVNLKMMPSHKWSADFSSYLHTIPPYYMKPLKNALMQFGVNKSFVESINSNWQPPYIMSAELKSIKNDADAEIEKMHHAHRSNQHAKQSSTSKRRKSDISVSNGAPTGSPDLIDYRKVLRDTAGQQQEQEQDQTEQQSSSGSNESIPSSLPPIQFDAQRKVGVTANGMFVHTNPFDIGREILSTQLHRMNHILFRDHTFSKRGSEHKPAPIVTSGTPTPAERPFAGNAAFGYPSDSEYSSGGDSPLSKQIIRCNGNIDIEEHRFNVPISKMGNYTEALNRKQVLRDPFAFEEETTERGASPFGSPYRKSRKKREMKKNKLALSQIDEADEATAAAGKKSEGPESNSRTPSDSSQPEQVPTSESEEEESIVKEEKNVPVAMEIDKESSKLSHQKESQEKTEAKSTPEQKQKSQSETFDISSESDRRELQSKENQQRIRTQPSISSLKQETKQKPSSLKSKKRNAVVISPSVFSRGVAVNMHRRVSYLNAQHVNPNIKRRVLRLIRGSRNRHLVENVMKNVRAMEGDSTSKCEMLKHLIILSENYKQHRLSQKLREYKKSV
eukprot:gb/GECH01004165.1/.p1 GENE.gb/GECH01004165.1/~~gb/GECH01004165.1/.p1  ORF type:complete len:939 (+),score=200.19 gb/GECH01004165.1/:1-2817(+)